MALETPIETLKNNKEKKEKVFSKKNAKGRYYSNMGKMASKSKPKPRHKPKNTKKSPEVSPQPSEEKKPEEDKSKDSKDTNFEHKTGFFNKAINGIYQSLVDTGYLADLNDHEEDFDADLYEKVGKNRPGDDPNTNLNNVLGHGAANKGSQKFNLKPLEQPLKSIDSNLKTFSGSFKLIETELKSHTQLLKDIKSNTAKIITSEKDNGDDNSQTENKEPKNNDKKIDNLISTLKAV